jgi:hypothetical protein
MIGFLSLMGRVQNPAEVYLSATEARLDTLDVRTIKVQGETAGFPELACKISCLEES